jgi:hypothetical protein
MKLGDRLRNPESGWSGTITNLFDDEAVPVDEIENPSAVVVHLDEPLGNGRWLTLGPLKPGDIRPARLH